MKRFPGNHYFLKFLMPLLFSTFTTSNSIAQLLWQQTKGPFGGSISALAINGSGDIFAAVYGGGVFRSINNGKSWSAVNHGLLTTVISSLVINKTTGDIFAGSLTGSVHRSRDNGNNWEVIWQAALTSSGVQDLTITNSGDVFVGLGARANEPGEGVFRSTDNGNSWEAVNSGLTSMYISALITNANGYIFAANSRGGDKIFRSQDNGESWIGLNNGLTRTSYTLATNASGHIFAGTGGGGVFRSLDNGDTWTVVNEGSEPFFVDALAVSENGDIFAGTFGDGVFRSTDNGDNWTAFNTGLEDVFVNAIVTKRSGDIFVGANGNGVFHAPNTDSSWTAVNDGLKITNIVTLLNAGGYIFAGTSVGLFRSHDNGDSWTPAHRDLVGSLRGLASTSNGDIFAATDNGVFWTNNDGDHWQRVSRFLTNTNILALAIDNVGHIYAGTRGGGVFRCTDDGGSWASKGLTNRIIQALAINEDGHVFAASDNAVFRSTNNGDEWPMFGSTFATTNKIAALAINTKRGLIFAGTDIAGVFRSTDNAGNWEPVNLGLTNTNVQALAINDSGHIFVGTIGGGVFRSRDDGNSWKPENTGLTDSNIQVLAIKESGHIFAGSRGSGVFRGLDYPTTVSISTNIDFATLENASDYKATDYRIVGLPGASNLSVSTFLTGEQGIDWQVYWDNGSESSNPRVFLDEFDGSDKFQFKTGRAFWIISRDTLEIDLQEVQAAELNFGREAKVAIHSGWNLITNPFNRSIEWSAVQAANGNFTEKIHSFTDRFRPPDNFEPYKGYYFYNATGDSILRVPLFATSGAPSTNQQHLWNIKISLTSGDFLDESTSFGIASTASRELDRHEYRKPRAVEIIPSVYFHKPNWDPKYSIFATDFRPEFEEAETWDFDVLIPQKQLATLDFSGLESVPADYEIYLIDDERGDIINLRVNSLYKFTPQKEITKFRVLAGNGDAVQETLASVVPKEFELDNNYPNPFNPSTRIPVAVPTDSKIELKVYNILGREVGTIYSGQISAGRHLFEWNGKNSLGHLLSSGVYFYRLTSDKKVSLTGKMILMK